MKKFVVRLRVKELMKAQIDKDITSDRELAELLNVNPTQVWRTKLPVDDKRNNAPGNQFIAGVMEVFGGRFDDYFYIEEVDVPKKSKEKVVV
ncbi:MULTISPECIES: hypothetical protein [unclassified Paenibacillus]|uniref:hypothetical protein n=1 Tax=unclassified Paenibacillus TaxID=185978 RepID=UPI003019F259